jgi:hypothetical protein
VLSLLGPVSARAQACHGIGTDSLATKSWAAPLDHRISFQAHDTSLRDVLDRLAVTARIRLSYSGELLPVRRVECIAVTNTAVGDILAALLHGTVMSPTIVGPDQVALAPRAPTPAGDPTTVASVGVLERVVVTGTATGGAERPITIGLDVHNTQFAYPNTYTQRSTGFSSVLGLPVSNYTRAFIGYSYEEVRVFDVNPAYLSPLVLSSNPILAESLLVDQGGRRRVSKISPRLVYDTVNQPLYPTAGTRYSLGFGFAGIGGLSELEDGAKILDWYLAQQKQK